MREHRDQHETGPRGRTEPTLGDLSNLEAPPTPPVQPLPDLRAERRTSRESPPHRLPPRRRGVVWLVLALVLVGAVVVWTQADRLRGMVPRTELNVVLGQAGQALQDGRLDGRDGTSARELYQSALEQQPDSDAARDGLQQVGRALVAQADSQLQAGQLDAAATSAATARELLGGGRDVDRLDQAIAARRAPAPATPDLVDQAQRALAAGKLDGDRGAIALYRRIAHADPGSAVAAHGLAQVASMLATQAQQALAAHDAATANARIARLAALQPDNGALPALHAAQAQLAAPDEPTSAAPMPVPAAESAPVAAQPAAAPARLPPAPPPVRAAPVVEAPAVAAPAVDARAVAAQVRQGQAALRAGRMLGEGNDTALAHFKAALRLDPDSAAARDGLGKIAQALTVRATAAADAGDGAQAAQLLKQAALLAPHSADLAAAQAHVATVPAAGGQPADAADAGADAAPVLSPADSAKVARLVEQARAATAAGDITMPPGASAYDLYRNALAIDGNSAAALRGMQTLPEAVHRQFQSALASGNLGRAGNALANYAELAPGDARGAAMSARLVTALLDQADMRLDQGDRGGAAQALDRARHLAPNNPRLARLSARLAGR